MQFRTRHGAHGHTIVSKDDCEVSIVTLPEGSKVVMTHTSGGMGVVRRLSEMGLTPGCEVRLLRKCSFHGPIEIEVRGVSLAIGFGLAEKIFVQPLKAE